MNGFLGPLRFGHHSHRGPRESNQDTVLSIALPDDRWLLAVADGMGGLEEGELASKVALSALYQGLLDGADLEHATHLANAEVYKKAEGRAMGSTLVAAVLSGHRADVVHVGDSRAYLSDLLGLVQVTQDHSMAAEALRDGSASVLDVSESSERWAGALARYLGAAETVRPDRHGPLDLVEGGWLLLCSDGLHSVLSLDELDEFLVGQVDAQAAAAGLVEEALARNTGDNVSVVLSHWPDPARPSQKGPEVATRPLSRSRGGILIEGGRPKPKKRGRGLAVWVSIVVIPLLAVLLFLLLRTVFSTP